MKLLYKPSLLIYYIGLIVISALIFESFFGFVNVNPTNYNWLYKKTTDMLPDIATWEHYKYANTKGLPLGTFESYAYPQLIGVGNTNIVPWLHMPIKPFSHTLPPHFHLFGIFVLLCFVLQIYFGDLLFKQWGVPISIERFMGVTLLVIAPPLLFRLSHIALMAHWIILAGLVVFFSKQKIILKCLWYFTLGFFSVTTHPYLVLFPMLMGFASVLQDFFVAKNKQVGRLALLLFSSPLGVLLGAWISGIFSLPAGASSSSGLGYYASNLNTFFNNFGKSNSTFLHLPVQQAGQYEGMAYLGLGVLILWVTVLCIKSCRIILAEKIKKYWTLVLVALLAFIYATGLELSFNEHYLFPIPHSKRGFIYATLSIFRSSGRYIWLVFYLLSTVPFYLIFCAKFKSKWLKAFLISGIGVLQFWDMHPLYKRFIDGSYADSVPYLEALKNVTAKAGIVYTYPAYSRSIVGDDDAQLLTGLIGRYQTKITAGHLPRPDHAEQGKISDQINQIFRQAIWTIPDTAVILTSVHEAGVFKQLQDTRTIKSFQLGEYVMITNLKNEKLHYWLSKNQWSSYLIENISPFDFIKENDNGLLITITVDEATAGLNQDNRNELAQVMPLYGNLGINESFISIRLNGSVVYENKGAAGSNIEIDTVINISGKPINIFIKSTSGIEDKAVISINNKEVISPARGLNMVNINKNGELESSLIIDTYNSYYSSKQKVYKP